MCVWFVCCGVCVVVCVCRDLGVYIANMDDNGFAAKSGKLRVMDRILACNGCDFTKSMPSRQVEDVFGKMVREPLLRMAISRGGKLKEDMQRSMEVGGSGLDVPVSEDVSVTDREGVSGGDGGEGDVEENRQQEVGSKPAVKPPGECV